ncbi:MAG: hypothetical protein K9G64_05585 [Bacteroidia bacterium]|nr:hypothetical protein [Bacteroidia bacterium]
MLNKKLDLINEQTSPLFRIMWIYNVNEPDKKQFDNNISAFHIGNGFVLSVAHNLKTEAQFFKSIDNEIYKTEILPFLNVIQLQTFEHFLKLDSITNKRYLSNVNQQNIQTIIDILKQINFDTRWVTFTQKNICLPHLIVQFKENIFYNDETITAQFDSNTCFHEPAINRHTFLVELALVEAFYSADIALYKIVNTPQNIINKLPSIPFDFSVLNDDESSMFCLQSSPGGFLGRLLNKAQIEGFLDHHGTFGDRVGGNFIFEGLRYLIKGYFRFGSSGAPYVFYDKKSKQFKVNAVQSEASPIQLSINNNRDGNYQYVNAIASPLSLVKERLLAHFVNQ